MTRRWQFLLATLGYLLFVVYGSLVPLEFVPLHWDEARARFARIPYLELRVASRADWVANLLLFIPLAYLWAGALWRCGRTAWNALALSAVVLVGAALSVAIEFVQLYFPQRTVSINDIVAEAAGAVIGVLLWWSTGEPLLRWLEAGARERNPTGWTERVLYVYLAVFCAYSVLPLDLTISPIEIYHKWNAGKVLLVPFSATYTSTANAVYDMGGDVLIWIPVAVLWRISGRLSPLEVWLRVTMAALLLEVLQLFVYSRVTDTTDVLMAMVGGLIGVMLGGRLAAHADMPVDRQRSSRAWRLWALAFAVWLAIIALVFWYPFEVRVERIFVTDRLRQLWRVPFMTYYFGSEYRAITEVLHKMVFFMPGGALLAWASFRAPAGALRGVALLGAGLLVSGLALTIELGQVLMPGKVADATDWSLETLGGLLGGFVTLQWLKRRATVSAGDQVRLDNARGT